MIVGNKDLYEETKVSLARIQDFDAQTLPRITNLGRQADFGGVVELAQQLINFYKSLPITALQDFPDQVLKLIKDHANRDYQIFSQILEFDLPDDILPADIFPTDILPTDILPADILPTDILPTDPNNIRIKVIDNIRTDLINQISTAYQPTFQALNQYISYSLQRSADFQRLDSEARATLQEIKDKTKKISDNLVAHETQAKSALDQILLIATEGGVTKQAAHFNAEHKHHTKEAAKWQKSTVKWARVLIAFAVLSILIHKIPFLKPEDIYDTIQLSISKFLIFSVMAYMLFLSAKNFLNHKHNSIVNKHRQNALMTHAALVEASGDLGVRDAVLLQASSCIFSPQSTGYTVGGENDLSNQKSTVEILSRPVVQAIKEVDK